VMRKEADTDKKEIADLQEKYSEKARQKRKLEELYDSLKQKSDGVYSRNSAGYLTMGYENDVSIPPRRETIGMHTKERIQSPTMTRGPTMNFMHPTKSSSPIRPTILQPDTENIDRFSYARRQSPAKITEIGRSPDRLSMNAPTPTPRRQVFRTLKIPESPRFSRFANKTPNF